MLLWLNHAFYHIVQPSQPRNLSYNVISTSVALEWNPPLTVGVPTYSNYIITFVSDVAITTLYMTNETVFTLDNLNPGTFYNVSVRAASDVFTDGGDQSNIISFTTDTSGMRYAQDAPYQLCIHHKLCTDAHNWPIDCMMIESPAWFGHLGLLNQYCTSPCRLIIDTQES